MIEDFKSRTFERREEKSSFGSTLNLNCPFLLSKRSSIDFGGGIM